MNDQNDWTDTDAGKQLQFRRDEWPGANRRQSENGWKRKLFDAISSRGQGQGQGDSVIVLCAWCKKYLHGHGDSAVAVSHGICKPCAEELMRDAAQRSRMVNRGGNDGNGGNGGNGETL